MSKYSKKLEEGLYNKVHDIVEKTTLKSWGINVLPIRLVKSKTNVIEIVVGNDVAKLFTGQENIVALALKEEVFLLLDDESQDVLIKSALSRISFNPDKNKVVIAKPELSVSIDMYREYGSQLIDTMECAYMTLQQANEIEKNTKSSKQEE